MLKLTSFIAAIQQAIDNASTLVAQQNLANISSYFHQDNTESPVADAINKTSLGQDYTVLRPKMVAMLYPRDTPKGVVEHTVMVPLLSLAPVSNLQPEEITIEIDLEFLEKDDDVIIGFPQLKKTMFGADKILDTKPNAKMTLKINAANRPAGISAIIEGYDKSLRAQIPN